MWPPLRRYSLIFALVLLCGTLTAQISSDFPTNADGWTTPNDADATIAYNATGGNPGGYVSGSPFFITTGSGNIYLYFYFIAPAKFLGNRNAYYDGTLRFDLQQSTTNTSTQHAEVIIRNGGTSLFYYPSVPFQPLAAPTWTTFSVALNDEAGFWKTTDSPTGTAATEAQIRAVLTNLTGLEIRGLFRDANTTNRLDNVTLMPPIIINTQPSGTAVCNGGTATFTTAASGNANITYQWQRETSPSVWGNVANTGGYTGTTTNTLSVNTSGNFGAGTYRCRISGTAANDVVTSTVTLTINALPVAPSTTGSASCTPGSVTVSASGGTAGQYRWYTASTGGTPIAGAINSTYTTPVLSITTSYYVAIYNGTCESTRSTVVATIAAPGCDNHPPVIQSTPISTQIEGIITLSLEELISDSDNNLDLSTLSIISPPSSGATAAIDTDFNLIIDYGGIAYSGKENITLQVCDIYSACTQQAFSIEVVGAIEIFNALSPNHDDKNDIFLIEHIEKLEDTRRNYVTIYNRWGDIVWEGANYNNASIVFMGKSKNNDDLPSGTYFFKIEFPGGRKAQTGYLSLKK